MASIHSIFDKPHHQSLELLAAQCLASGDVETAYKYADRRCRIEPIADPHSYLLRAEAAYKLGDQRSAIADVGQALQIAPDNILANRRMLAWARGSERVKAAKSLITNERNFDVLRQAVQILQRNGQKNLAQITVLDDAIEGWAVWCADTCLEVTINGGASSVVNRFEQDRLHPLSECGRATSFRVERPRLVNSETILLSVSGNVFHASDRPGKSCAPIPRARPLVSNTDTRQVTVIVPVYGDYKATRRCLQSLLVELKSSDHRAIVVDDASPDARIVRFVIKLKSQPRIELLSNKRNLGFIGSVNRALEQVTMGDVILLNADTIVPQGFIDRVAKIAHSSKDIGTVSPLSNNSELTSFPIPNVANPIASLDEIAQIDAIAAKVNAKRTIDIPTGTGFCLYITRACLAAVGTLSTHFHSGYLEDVNFCLRARELGFRNVCAPSIYLGHAGSKSYGSDKRSLVVRNLSVLEKQFPTHRLECAAFMAADPLRVARREIERATIPFGNRPKLLVTGAGVIAAAARKIARALYRDAEPVLILEVRKSLEGPVVRLFNALGYIPQSLEFTLSRRKDWRLFVELVKELHPSRIEFIDPSGVPLPLVSLLLKQESPHDILIADAGLLGHEQPILAAIGPRALDEYEVTRLWNGLTDDAQPTGKVWVKRWQKIANNAEKIIAASNEGKAFAVNLFPRRRIAMLKVDNSIADAYQRLTNRPHANHLGFIPVRSDADEQQLINVVIRDLRKLSHDLSFTVVGSLFDDLALMRASNAFVTGPINADEFHRAVNLLGLSCLFVCATRPLFEHPTLWSVRALPLPKTYFDWSGGQIKPKKKDLLLDPSLPLAAITAKLNQWMHRR